MNKINSIQKPDEAAVIAEIKPPWWLTFMPPIIKKQIAHRIDLLGASDSFIWLSLDSGMLMGFGFIINILLARSLGPEQFGYLSYLLAFFSIFLPISKLGLPNIIVKQLAREPQNKNAILGTGFILRVGAGLLTLFLSVTAMFIIRPNDQLSQLLISFLGLMALLQSLEVVDYYFQSKLLLKKLTIKKIAAIIAATILKMGAIYFSLSLTVILFLSAVEAFLVGIAFISTYTKTDSMLAWNFNPKLARQLVRHSLPLLFSSVVIMGYAQADQVFLNFYRGPTQLAQYSVTIVIMNGLALLPVIIQKAVAPVLMKANQKKHAQMFNNQLKQLYRLMTILSIVVGLLLVFFGPLLIQILYGNAYTEAGYILALLPFRFFFVSFGVIRSLYVVSHNLFDYDVVTNIAGVVVSVIASITFIPQYGIYGLLIASFLSLLTSTFIMDLFHHKLRTNVTLALEAISSPHKFTLN
jgi:PST family polysaccharide transporter